MSAETQLVEIRSYSQDGRLGVEGGLGLLDVRVHAQPSPANGHCAECGGEFVMAECVCPT